MLLNNRNFSAVNHNNYRNDSLSNSVSEEFNLVFLFFRF